MLGIRALACSAILLNLLEAANPAPPQFLLPDNVRPVRYAVDLTVNPSEASFRGVAKIELEFGENTSLLWLNGKDLIVESAVLRIGGQSLSVQATPGGDEFLGFSLPQNIGLGPAELEIQYRAGLSDKATVGAFRRRSGRDWYAFTTFTAIEARRAFPCFDEPRYKTPWQLTLHVKRELVALANTHAISEREEARGMKQVVFAATEPLPSSQIAFAVGPFEIVDAGRAGKNHVPVRIITPRGRSSEAAAAREATPRLLEQIEEYTGIPYPWDKLDHLALLEGAFGGIEQPGLIAYRQRILLATPARDTPEHRRLMRGIMAHELAHQWFGNLVTMSGWEDVWLSEGFATWMSQKLMDQENSRSRSKVFAVAARNRIMASDTRPVRLPMRSREQMKDVYSPVVYQKGSATLEMIEHWVGPGAFRRGIQNYLNQHQFANAATSDFIHSISQAAGRDVGEVARSFLDQAGFPVLSATVRCGSGSARVALHQAPFLAQGPSEAGTWRLPVCIKAEGVAGLCQVIETHDAEVALTDAKTCPSWVFLNAGASGYYRTRLDVGQLDGLAHSTLQLTAAERLTMALDVSALTVSGRMPASQALDLIPSMAADEEPLVALAARELAVTLAAIVPASLKTKYDRYLQSVFGTAPAALASQVEALRKAQQASLIEFLNR